MALALTGRGTTRRVCSVGSGPPRDQRVHKLLSVNAVVYAVVCVLAAVGIVVTAIFLAVNIRFRHHR